MRISAKQTLLNENKLCIHQATFQAHRGTPPYNNCEII